MPTKNPKVSAYISQHIFDRFQSFCQEKGMSMSQATAVVFAGYFEIEPEVNHLSGLLADRIKDLELKLSELSSSSSRAPELSKQVISELKTELSGVLLKEIRSSIDETQKTLFARLRSELESSLPKEQEKEPLASLPSEPQPKSIDSEDCGELDEQGNKQLDLAVEQRSSNGSDSKKPSKPKPKKPNSSKKTTDIGSANGKNILTTAQLAERFRCDPSFVSKQKGRYKNELEKFTNWSKGKDPDGFSWESKQGSVLYYQVEPLA